jgi:ATP-dependent DNA helicase RecQ
MGIDAPNVRLVVHWSMPPTWSPYQEAGRAGRDGRRHAASCYTGKATAAGSGNNSTSLSAGARCGRIWRDAEAVKRAPVSLRESAERLRQEVLDPSGKADWGPVKRRRKLADARIGSVEKYATTRGCRRSVLLGYFGERLHGCAGCDHCGLPR